MIHTQNTTSTGTLEAPYQPFGKSFKLCLWDEKEHKTYTTTYADEKILGTKIFLYLGESEGTYADGNGHNVEVKKNQFSNTC